MPTEQAQPSVVWGGVGRPWSQARSRRRFRLRRRGVSEVLATILLLAMTVTLFSAIFAFVVRFPAPPAQSVNQFQASLVQNATGAISQLTILDAGGPTVSSSAKVILQVSRSTTNWQFGMTSGIPIAWGIGNVTTGMNAGQYWTTTFTPAVKVPANLTVYILSPTSTLLFQGVVPGYSTNSEPVITSTYTSPATPAIGATFQIVAVVSGNTTGLSLNVSVVEIPGLGSLCSTTCSMTYSSSLKAWTYTVPAGDTTTAGSYLAFVQGSSSSTGATVSGNVAVTIPSSGGGGGSNGLSVTVGLNPNPLAARTNGTIIADVANAGSSSATVSNVTYYVNYTSNSTAVAVLYDKGTLPTVSASSSTGAPSSVWMVPPKAQAAVTVTILVSFSSGVHISGSLATTVAAAPFTASVAVLDGNSTPRASGLWYVLVTVNNYGSLGGNTLNITIYTNKTSSTTAEGTVDPGTGSGKGVGYALAGTFGANTSATYTAEWVGPGGSAISITVQVLVKVTNSASWTAFSSSFQLYSAKWPALSTSFTD